MGLFLMLDYNYRYFMVKNVFRGTKLENLLKIPEPHARLDAPLRKMLSTLRVLTCALVSFFSVRSNL